MEPTRPQPDRDTTDESLQDERRLHDESTSERLIRNEENADRLIAGARAEADSVLEAAREAADLGLEAPAAATIDQRRVADQLLDEERAAADEQTLLERRRHSRMLAVLMPLERMRTDSALLTERARADEKMGDRDDFLGMISHDLRGLLCGILLESSTLAEEAPDSEAGRSNIETAHRLQLYVARMNRLVGDLVDVASIDAGRFTVRLRHGDAQALLAETLGMFAPAAAEKGVGLELCGGGGALIARYDHDRMLQVLANLVSNAIKFTAPGGGVLVCGENGPDGLHFRVTDEGPGIPNAMRLRVFERFWQLDKNDQRGVGLGLHIAKCIVDAHGGRIWCDGAPGEGSTFHCTIPVAQAA
jgi:signal transduction histidine kinase